MAQQRAKLTITRDCPICRQGICIMAGHTIPDEIVYVKTRRHTVVLAHKECVRKENKQNEHIQSKENK